MRATAFEAKIDRQNSLSLTPNISQTGMPFSGNDEPGMSLASMVDFNSGCVMHNEFSGLFETDISVPAGRLSRNATSWVLYSDESCSWKLPVVECLVGGR